MHYTYKTLVQKFNMLIEKIKENKPEDVIAEVLQSIKTEASNKLLNSKQVVLCGATPFAKKVIKDRNFMFAEDVDIVIEDFENIESINNNMGGGKIYILCSRPNISNHLKCLYRTDNHPLCMQWQLLLALEPRFSTNPFAYQYKKVVEQIEDIVIHIDEYVRLFEELGDIKSKELLIKMILFRLTYDHELHFDSATEYPHYFDEDICDISEQEVFVDCGGYIGDTLEEFIKVTKNKYKKYYLLEPDKDLIKQAMSRVDERIEFINKGVWSVDTELYMKNETANGNGMIIEQADSACDSVSVVALDSIIEEATFIKMDIEGSELMALNGARNVIKKFQPKLAICIYHKYDDPRVLYSLIRTMGEYKFYIRAQYDNIDTELYFLCIAK